MISIEYAAGFIEADGCISVHKNGSGNLTWEVSACQSDKNGNAPLLGMCERWGGCIFKAATDMWYWRVRGIEAAICLKDIYHHLQIKQDKATDALEWFNNHPKFGRVLRRINEPIY